MGNILIGLAEVIDMLLTIYMYLVIASAVISWVNPDPYNPIVRFLRRATDPVYYQIRRRAPWLNAGGLDLSPMLILLAIVFLKYAVVGNLRDYGLRLKGGIILP